MTVLVGSTSEGVAVDFVSAGATGAWSFVASASGLAKRLWLNPKVSNAPGETLRVGIYADNGAGLPGALLGATGTFTIPAGLGPYSFDISSLNISIVSGTRYHLALRDPQNFDFQGTSSAGAYRETLAVDFPDPFASSAASNVRLAIWVEDTVDVPAQFGTAGAIDAGTITSGAAWDPECPTPVETGDILIAHISCRNLTITPTTPAGWTLLTGPHATSVGRHWLFGKIAVGNEDLNAISFGTQATVNNRSGRIYRFIGSDWTGQDITQIVLGFAHGTGTVAAVADTGVTTTVDKCLALNFIKAEDNNTIGPFTGETGGDWTEAVAEASNNLDTGWMAQLQTATMMTAGTINGGTVTMSAADPWGVIGCYIRPPIPATPPPSGDTDNFFAFV